jgi:hypothetical protein
MWYKADPIKKTFIKCHDALSACSANIVSGGFASPRQRHMVSALLSAFLFELLEPAQARLIRAVMVNGCGMLVEGSRQCSEA